MCTPLYQLHECLCAQRKAIPDLAFLGTVTSLQFLQLQWSTCSMLLDLHRSTAGSILHSTCWSMMCQTATLSSKPNLLLFDAISFILSQPKILSIVNVPVSSHTRLHAQNGLRSVLNDSLSRTVHDKLWSALTSCFIDTLQVPKAGHQVQRHPV